MVSTDDTESARLPWESSFGEALRELRVEAGLSQNALAQELRRRDLPFHQQLIDRVERGARPIRLNEAIVISRFFGKELEEMFDSTLEPVDRATFTRRRLERMARRATQVQRDLTRAGQVLGTDVDLTTEVERDLESLAQTLDSRTHADLSHALESTRTYTSTLEDLISGALRRAGYVQSRGAESSELFREWTSRA